MNQITMTGSRQAASPATHRSAAIALRTALANLPMISLGLLLGAAFLTGHLAATTAGLALAGLSLLVTVVVLVFARRQLRADPRSASFARLAAGLAIATLMMALASDALLLTAAWVVTGRLMAGLIGHVGEWSEARDAARRANIAFAIGDLALVGAIVILSLGAGSSDIAAISAAVPAMVGPQLTLAAFLFVIAALARCALPPFSNWLMRSLAAPTPVSALMHAGFVNAGGFLLIRFAPALEAVITARSALFAAGIVAALVGSAIMLVRNDVKGALAASTVGQMGFMLLTVALGAYPAALWHMVAHGLFKAWLFLGSAGTICTAPTRAKSLPKPWPAIIALATLAAATTLIETQHADALLPVGLALTALLCALVVAMRAMPRGPVGLFVAVTPIVLIALNAAALAIMTGLQPSAAQPLVSPYAQVALLSLFLAGWIWQQQVVSGEKALPRPLYARLIHAGSSIPA